MDLRIRHPGGAQIISTLTEKSSISDLKREISKISGIVPSKIFLKLGYPPQKLDLPENTTLENVGIQSGETIIAEEDQSTDLQKTSSGQGKNENQSNGFNQTPNPDGLIMIRRIIPADNSCLFNSVAYALENKAKTKAKELRKIIASLIAKDPERFNEAILEKTNSLYCEWILKDESWGGAIELEIFSTYYEVEICTVDIENMITTVFGSNHNYKKRIYVLYDGIHYDIIARNISEDMDESLDITIFDPKDKYAYEGVLMLAKELNAKKQFTSLTKFTIQCGICYEKFVGEAEALSHGKKTGHTNFQEVSN